jgi:GMP synthase-like glutamine amidotransferase
MENISELFVLDPAVKTPEVDTLTLIADLAPTLRFSYHLPAILGMGTVYRREKTRTPGGIIVLGSSSHVTQGLAWQKELQVWLERKMREGVPTLGICFGHQLIGHIFGSRVMKYKPGTKLSGLRQVEVSGDKRLDLDPCTGELVVSHEEIVESLPPGFKQLAKSKEIAVDAMMHEKLPIWGWQPHIEAAELFCENMHVSSAEPGREFDFGHEMFKKFLGYI